MFPAATVYRWILAVTTFYQSRQALNAKLEPYTEALCRRYLPHGVKRDGQWRVSTVRGGEEHALTVQLSGAAKGSHIIALRGGSLTAKPRSAASAIGAEPSPSVGGEEEWLEVDGWPRPVG